MAFFGLFDKKICAICGGEIGLLGNRKLEDGNCCKKCAAKLSPWFDERRHSTVEQIKEQLAYREENQKAVEAFHTTRSIKADSWSVLLDEDANKFMLTKNPRKIAEENPDVISFSDITGVRMDVNEDSDEIKRTIKQGDETKEVSYNPPRYKYEYNFKYIINVNNPYFNEMKFPLNTFTVDVIPPDSAESAGQGLLAIAASLTQTKFEPMRSPEYEKYKKIGDEITEALTGAKSEAAEEEAAASAPPKIVVCPYCGAQTEMTDSKKCQYCGGYLGE